MTTDTSEQRHEPATAQPLSFHTDPDRGPITAAYAQNLTRVLIAERPDWHPREVGAALDECRDEQIPDLRRAAFIVAERPGSTPAEIAQVGEHWSAVNIPEPPSSAPPSPDAPEECPRHPGRPRWECQDCTPRTNGRGDRFWETVRESAERDRQRRIQIALEEDRRRMERLGVPEPRHA